MEYESLSTAIVSVGGYVSAAELQGLTCGHLCAGTRFGRDDYATAVTEWLGREPPDEIVGLCAEMLLQLEDAGMSFALLLPDDDSPVAQRVSELTAFCKGFLAGFGLAGRLSKDEVSEGLTEVLSDMAEIAQASEGVEDGEENESDFSVIAEHVRVGVLIAFSELASAQTH